eukprot:m.238288 g.238288  ORF g.238288 m.238288 type:complete len:550 (-) comp13282_c0_seq1:205-1854(-)
MAAALAQSALVEPSPFETLSDDLLFVVLSFLRRQDLPAVMATCRRFRDIMATPLFWARAYQREFAGQGFPVPEDLPPREKYKHATALDSLDTVQWHLPAVAAARQPTAPPGAEGHGWVRWGDYGIFCGAFTMRGMTTQAYALDLRALPGAVWVKVVMAGPRPPNVYGHTITQISESDLLYYGGCEFGGYRGAIAAAVVLRMGVRDGMVQCTVQPYRGPCGLSTRAYHTAHVLPQDPTKILMVGGLDDSEDGPPFLELFDTVAWRTVPLTPIGEPPARRYGHAAGIVNGRLWVLGGCSGDDIRRSGEDHRDVHVADLCAILDTGVVRWIEIPQVAPVRPRRLPQFHRLPGRELCSVVMGSKIVMFGGSTNHMQQDETTDEVLIFDTTTMTYKYPIVASTRPMACVSPEAILYGKYMVLYGGWTLEGLLRGPSILDLDCAHLAPDEAELLQRRHWRRKPRQVSSTGHGSALYQQLAAVFGMYASGQFSQVDTGGDEDEDEDEDDEDADAAAAGFEEADDDQIDHDESWHGHDTMEVDEDDDVDDDDVDEVD